MRSFLIKKHDPENSGNIRMACYLILIMLAVVMGFILMGRDMQSLLRFYLAFWALGIVVMPAVRLIFGGLGSDGAYVFGRAFGLALCGYLMWLLSSVHILPFNVLCSILCAVIIGIAGYGLLFLNYRKNRNKADVEDEGGDEDEVSAGFFGSLFAIEDIVKWELVFLLIFVFLTWLFARRVPSYETERIMDYAFMVSLDKTSYMPPLDMWASGGFINYYYFGQYLVTYLCKISFVDIAYGYSLAMSLIGTCVIIFSYVIVRALLARSGAVRAKAPVFGGIIAALAVTCCGNFHYVVFGKIVPALWDMLQLEGEKPTYWFANSTRYIGYIPNVEADRTISEFPWYSLIIGDLHAHVIDMIIVLTIVSVVLSLAFINADKAFACRNGSAGPDADTLADTGKKTADSLIGGSKLLTDLFTPNTIALGFLLGIAAMTNYWDFPIYYVVAGSIILFFNIYRYGLMPYSFGLTAITGVFVYVETGLIKLPFDIKFKKMMNGIALCEYHSKLYQWLILWGLPLLVLIVYAFFLFHTYKKKETDVEKDAETDIDTDIEPYGRRPVSASDLSVLLIGLCGIGLAILPEIIFVKDIYIEGFPRCNTMFKLTYEAFILLGLMMGYVIARILGSASDAADSLREFAAFSRIRGASVFALCLLILTLGYPVTSCRMWYGEPSEWSYKGLDSTFTARMDMGEEAEVLEWIRNNLKGQEIILTAEADSYSTQGLISALSGHPTVLGWRTHEWLWHNSREYVNVRAEDIRAIYTATDNAIAKELIDRYGIEYIYVGPTELEKYGQIDIDRLSSLGSIVYRDNSISSVIIRCAE